MRRRFVPFMLSALLMTGAAILRPAPALAVEYLSVISDLPLADGLSELKDHATVFDAALGHIAAAYATGNVAADAVHAFYDATLPQLGWTREAKGLYHRPHQTLKIDALGGNGSATTVSFTLSTESE